MKIVFMGSPDFAAGILKALLKEGHEVVGCVAQPDKPKGRKNVITPGPVAACAISEGISLFQPAKARDPEFLESMKALRPEMIVVAAYGKIIPKELLELPAFGCINVHASLLPAWRGASPIQHMILAGDKEAGVTIMRMDEGLDTGDIIAARSFPLGPEETGGSLFDRLMEEGAELLVETIPKIADGSAVYTPQPPESTTPYAAMISKDSGRIDWTEDAAVIERMVRAYDPWPSAWTTLGGKRIRIWKSRTAETRGVPTEAVPDEPALRSEDQGIDRIREESDVSEAGGILFCGKEGIAAACGKGILMIAELQPEGKRRMTADEYIRGVRELPDRFT